MIFTPQARRLVSDLVSIYTDAEHRSLWEQWCAAPQSTQSALVRRFDVKADTIPPAIAEIARDALVRADFWITHRLSDASLDDDSHADLINELGFIRAIKSDLEKESSLEPSRA